jgi:hypothetical protein
MTCLKVIRLNECGRAAPRRTASRVDGGPAHEVIEIDFPVEIY